MPITNYRTSISGFNTISLTLQPYVTKLTHSKTSGEYVSADVIPGGSDSSIIHMTQPTAQNSENQDIFSPYMLHLIDDPALLTFAESVLYAAENRTLAALGLDNPNKTKHRTERHTDQKNITDFYNNGADSIVFHNSRPTPITLNGSCFLEQEPTKPYFPMQKIITPNFTNYRNNPEIPRPNLFDCGFRDDSRVFFNKTPILRLQEHNTDVYVKESSSRIENETPNETQYFSEMMDYLIQRGSSRDFIVQNSLETSSDKRMVHFVYVPGGVSLPLFSRAAQHDSNFDGEFVDWHLPTVRKSINLQNSGWREQTEQLQDQCKTLLESHHISTTPLFRKLDHDQIEVFLIFKKDCSNEWNLAPSDLKNAPGWLEASGIFIADSDKAHAFSTLGAENYYASYRVTGEEMDTIQNTFAC